MYELVQISDRSFYIESPTKIGVVKLSDKEVCLIDSGNNKDSGRRAKKILDANGWELKAIYNTHSNADHIGGNRYLKTQTGCSIYVPDINCDFTRHTILSPSFLYGGYPCSDLRHKFLLAQESDAESLKKEVLPEGFEIIELPGHYFDMVGYRTPDDVVYLADCLMSRHTIEKYQIGFIYDVAAYLDTLEMVKTLKAKVFVPSHAEAVSDICELAQCNIDKVNEIADKIMEFCKEPVSFEILLQKLFDEYDLNMDMEQNVLVGSTVRSYLAWLKDSGKLNYRIENNLLMWETCQ